MPELPDLVYIQGQLQKAVCGIEVENLELKKPLVLRKLIAEELQEKFSGRVITQVVLKSPFLRFDFSNDVFLVYNLMLTGRLQYQARGEKAAGHLAFSLEFSNGSYLNLLDDKQMAKVYACTGSQLSAMPKYKDLGIDLLSKDFTEEFFIKAIAKDRRQVRVFIMDSSIFSSIGNAYADEILFEAKVHPKTMCNKLTPLMKKELFTAIKKVIGVSISYVEQAGKPIEKKVRDHLQVRNNKGKPCPRCGEKIRRAGVYGHDTFFCPACQLEPANSWLQWQKPGSGASNR